MRDESGEEEASAEDDDERKDPFRVPPPPPPPIFHTFEKEGRERTPTRVPSGRGDE